MRKNIVLFIMLLAVVFAATAFAAPQEEGGKGGTMTQGELAQKLVKMLGLQRFLPPAPTVMECFDILMKNGVSPKDVWESDKPVTREDLAMIVIKAMGQEDSVENPDDPASWVEALQAMGVPIDEDALKNMPPAKNPHSGKFGPSPSDPIIQQHILGQPDENELQSDMNYVPATPLSRREVLFVLRGIDPNDVKPDPVTPN